MTTADLVIALCTAAAAIAGLLLEMRRTGQDTTDTRERLIRCEERISQWSDALARVERRVDDLAPPSGKP